LRANQGGGTVESGMRSVMMRTVAVAVVVAIALVACSSSRTATLGSPPPPAASRVDVRNPFNPVRPFVFGGGDPDHASITASSRALAASAKVPAGATVTPLPSTPQTAAVEVLERDPPGKFGDLLAIGEKAVFERLARDRSLGPWLIVISALAGQGSSIAPPVVDRWARSAVEEYARCGIPSTGSNSCKTRFFARATEATIHQGGGVSTGA
jgi:hypothetical protein